MSISLSAERGERRRIAEGTAFSIILALGFSHFLNDTMQSLLPALASSNRPMNVTPMPTASE